MKRGFPLLFAVLSVAVIGGCGGDSDDTTTISPAPEAPQSLSKPTYIDQGDAICAEVNVALGSLEAATSGVSLVQQEAALYQGMIDRLRTLPRPTDDAGLEQFFAAGDALVNAAQDAVLAAQRGDDASLVSAQEDVSTNVADLAQAAEAYGFQECGAGPSAPSSTGVVPGAPTTGGTIPTSPGVAPTPVAPAPTAPAPLPPPPPPSIAGGVGGEEPGGGDGTSGGGGTGGIGPG